MYWSLSLDVQIKDHSLKTLKEIQFKNRTEMYEIFNDISSEFSSYSIGENVAFKSDSEYIRLETCPVKEKNDPKDVIAEIVSESYFDIKCKKDIENYFKEIEIKKDNTMAGFHILGVQNGTLVLNKQQLYHWHIPKSLRESPIKKGDIVLVRAKNSKRPVLVMDVFREEYEETGKKYKTMTRVLERVKE